MGWKSWKNRQKRYQHGGDSEYGKNEAHREWSKGLLAVYERRMPHTFW